MRRASILVLACSGALAPGCGSSTTDATSTTTASTTTTSPTTTTGGSGGQGQGGGGAGAGGATSAGGAGGAGGTTSAGGAGGAGADYTPTPGDIQYGAHLPLPAGESILFNDWNSTPNRLLAMKPDGSGVTEIFRAYRLWSLGGTPDGAKVAFACGDPKQKEHYGLDLGDAIQHTWLYDAASQAITLLAKGNINDECHLFGPGAKSLYVCRRYDFKADMTSKGYRIGRIDVATQAFDWLAPDAAGEMTLHPTPTLDETALFFTHIAIAGGKQSRSIEREAIPPGAPTVISKSTSAPRLSPDGTRLLYTDYGQGGTLWSSKPDGTDPVKVVDRAASDARFSPDGARVVYLLSDQANNCQHVEIAKADGSESATPTRLRDCVGKNEFVTAVDWVSRPN
jgi:hypothetical protein